MFPISTSEDKTPLRLSAFVKRKTPGCLFIITFLIVSVVFLDFLNSRTYRLADNVYSLPLVAGCDLQIYFKPAQPRHTIALACPGRDMLRLWPLPWVSPWFEDPRIDPTRDYQAACISVDKLPK